MGGGVVVADAFAGLGGGVEEREVVGHAGPHACDHDAEEEAEETGGGQMLASCF